MLAHIMNLFFFQAEDGIRDLVRSRGLGDVYKRQDPSAWVAALTGTTQNDIIKEYLSRGTYAFPREVFLSLIHI